MFDTRNLARGVDRIERRGSGWGILRSTMCREWNKEHDISKPGARGTITNDPSRLRRGAKQGIGEGFVKVLIEPGVSLPHDQELSTGR